MKRLFGVALTLWLGCVIVTSPAAAGNDSVIIASADWTVTAEVNAGSFTVEHRRWGTVLKEVQFYLRDVHGQHRLASWTAERSGENRLIVRTSEPTTAWVFELFGGLLKISCTSPDAVLTGKTPASQDRLVARILDQDGAPVVWQGTGEVAGGYGGRYTRNPSYLPRQNPGCMYFTLGPTSGSVFHSLFDRKTDVVLRFTDETRLQRSAKDPELLDVTLPVPGNALIRLLPDYYIKTLGVPYYVPFDDTYFGRAPTVWCSWTSYYGDVTEQAVIQNADWIAEHLKPYGFQYVQLDDGYDRGLKEGHYWIEHWDSREFPHGPKWLADYIKSKGLHAGLWLVPNAYAGAVAQHPDWYLRDRKGNIVLDYGTPALDSTHPEVLAFLRELFTTLKAWGFEYYKFDGEHALPQYVPAVDRSRLHDPTADPLIAYRERLKIIRDAIGPETFVEGCPAGTPLNGIGYFNSYFNGQDVYNNWNGMHALLSSINANAFLNHIVVYVMPGEGMELGPHMSVEEARQKRPAEVVETARTRENPMTGFGVSIAEARTLVSCVALSGVVYPLAGVLPELPAERLPLLQSTLPPLPIVPIDLFSRGTDVDWDTFKHVRADDYIHNYPEVLDLKVNAVSGVYDVVALPNWRSWTVTKTVSFAAELGLDAEDRFIVFDFWNRKLLSVFRDEITVDVEGHDTRVLLIHPVLDRPQLLGTSRHISGAFSVRELDWDGTKRTLRGTAETVPGASYTLFVRVPEGTPVVRAEASVTSSGDVPVHAEQHGELLSITFDGKPEATRWRIEFGTPIGR